MSVTAPGPAKSNTRWFLRNPTKKGLQLYCNFLHSTIFYVHAGSFLGNEDLTAGIYILHMNILKDIKGKKCKKMGGEERIEKKRIKIKMLENIYPCLTENGEVEEEEAGEGDDQASKLLEQEHKCIYFILK